MIWTALDTWIVIAGGLSAASCALLGCFLVLRRMSMMGDAISHAVLPGLAVAFLFSGSRESLPMFIGAAVVGVLTALLTQFIHRLGRVEESASMGVVFTTLFALGLILIVRAADKVDLDPGCVLYGSLESIPMHTTIIAGRAVPHAVVVLAPLLLINLMLVLVLYKEFKITTFDPALATTLGINAQVMHYLLMTLVAMTAVASFESVGSILVIAMLIVPAAAAHLLTDRLAVMLVLSVVIGLVSTIAGHVAAVIVPGWFGYPDTVTAGMMAVMAGLLFLVALMAAPRHGLVSRLLHRWLLSLRIVREDLLGMLYRVEELEPRMDRASPRPSTGWTDLRPVRHALATGPITVRAALVDLRRRGLVEPSRAGIAGMGLTDAGRRVAQSLVRSHRLWESFLVQHLNLPPDHVHDPAMRLEHVTDSALQRELADRVEHPPTDPHGRRIPGPAPAPSRGA